MGLEEGIVCEVADGPTIRREFLDPEGFGQEYMRTTGEKDIMYLQAGPAESKRTSIVLSEGCKWLDMGVFNNEAWWARGLPEAVREGRFQMWYGGLYVKLPVKPAE